MTIKQDQQQAVRDEQRRQAHQDQQQAPDPVDPPASNQPHQVDPAEQNRRNHEKAQAAHSKTWDDLDQEEQNQRTRSAILALADAIGNQANVEPVRALLK